MLMKEFTELTGIYPSTAMYEAIEDEYYRFEGDKREFCEAYKANKGGLAEKIAEAANDSITRERTKTKAHTLTLESDIESLKTQIEQFRKDLEREQEWRPYEDTHNVSEADYQALLTAGCTKTMTDDEAKDYIEHWVGFNREHISIIHKVPKEEANRHGRIRKVGELNRTPLYNATDWNYIRFSCMGRAYELYKDELRPFWR